MSRLFSILIAIVSIVVAGVCADGFAQPPVKPAPAGGALQQPLPGAGDIQAGLAEGFKIGSKFMTSAQAKFESARRQSPQDPRIDYAEGLAWGKQAQWSKAQEQFEHAVHSPGSPYWPAWKAWIWAAFREKQYEAGFERLLEMAKQVASLSEPKDQPAAAAAVDLAKWIGRLMSAVSRSDSAPKTTEAWARTVQQLEADLGPALFKAYEAGRLEFFKEQQEVLKKAQAKADVRSDKEKKSTQVEQAKIDGNLARAAKEKAEAKLSAAEWKKWVDTETAKVDKELVKLEKDYKFGAEQVTSLNESINLISRELTTLSFNEPPRTSVAHVAWENQVTSRQLQLGQYQNEVGVMSASMAELARQGSNLVAQRQEMVRQYEQATGVLLEKTADLTKWSTRLKDSKTKLQAKAMKPVNSKVSPTFSSYLPFDLESERDRVLRDVGIVVASP